MQRVRGVVAGMMVGVPLALYVYLWLHGVREVAGLIGAGVGLAIALVVGTRSDPRDAAADAAWREAAPDLPPVSDRTTLEGLQAKMPGPNGKAARDGRAPSGTSAAKGAEPR
ncbi:MAG: hypothetical protein ABSE70_07925 [Candidatus Limnocylindrales bacterium]